jgi:chaperone modulatory protein CbpM
MSATNDDALAAHLLDESTHLTLTELSRMCAVAERHIIEYVEEGVLRAVEVNTTWRFSGSELRRARRAVRLERDLELNLSGLALALDLMEEIDRLRLELNLRR